MVKWNIKKQNDTDISRICSRFNIDDLTARLLYNRGLTQERDILAFFDIDIANLYSPLLLRDMDKAVVRIERALQDKEKITVYGDYDVDGITSVVVLYKYLRSRGADVAYYIPDRAGEGYGLNEHALQQIAEDGTGLVITVDTGTTAVAETQWAAEHGLDIIVTDHHECKETLPQCQAVVNPKRMDSDYPFTELAGVGVVFKLLCALEKDAAAVFAQYGQLVAIGTIADIMPLTDENRIIVSLGLQSMRTKPMLPVRALMESCSGSRGPVGAGTVAFQIAPRLNAAGRIGDPGMSVELLLCEHYEMACTLSEKLCEENRLRQQMESDILKQAQEMIAGSVQTDKIIVAGSTNWHHGVIGIVASKLVETYHKPCILICFDGDRAKGSARSIRGVSMFDLLCSVSDCLEKFGGHEMAAGLTLSRDRYEDFVSAITAKANETITDEMLIPVVDAECMLSSSQITLKTARQIQQLEPFGAGNPTPYFCIRDLRILDIFSVGMGKHLKITLDLNGAEFTAMYFGMQLSDFDFAVGDSVSIICSMSENVFNNQSSLCLSIKSIRPDEAVLAENERVEALYHTYLQTGTVTDEMCMTREDMVGVYKYILRQTNAQQTRFQPFALARGLKMNYCRLMLALQVLSELGIIKVCFEHGIEIFLLDTKSKVNLSRSKTWLDIGKEE